VTDRFGLEPTVMTVAATVRGPDLRTVLVPPTRGFGEAPLEPKRSVRGPSYPSKTGVRVGQKWGDRFGSTKTVSPGLRPRRSSLLRHFYQAPRPAVLTHTLQIGVRHPYSR
jgi:hypothetical protein